MRRDGVGRSASRPGQPCAPACRDSACVHVDTLLYADVLFVQKCLFRRVIPVFFFLHVFCGVEPMHAHASQTQRCKHRAVQMGPLVFIHNRFSVSFSADFSQTAGGASLVPAKPSPPMPPKRTTPVTKRSTEDAPASSQHVNPTPHSGDEPAGFQLPPPPPSPPLPTHRPPSPPRQHVHTHHLHHQHSYPHPLPQPIPMLFDPPSPPAETPQRPAPVPLHIMIQRALSSPGPAQPHPDGSQRAHTLLFEMHAEYQGDRARPLPVSIQPLKL